MASHSKSDTAPTATSNTASTTAMKTRILNHMNADHKDSLSLFLQNYANLPSSMTRTPHLADITLSHLIVTCTAGRILIPLDPPMTSLSDSRTRMVAMHKASLSRLDLSDIPITSFHGPRRAWQWFTHGIVIFSALTLPFPAQLDPESGSWISWMWSLAGLVPGIAWLGSKIGWYAWLFILFMHTLEATVMARGRLRRHRVRLGSRVWWAWVGATWTGGIASFTVFDEVVRDEENRRSQVQGGKH